MGQRIGDELTADRKKTSDQYHSAKEAYLLLKNNFNQIGRYEDASWAYVKEQQMEKMAYYWEWHPYRWDAVPVFGSLARRLVWPAWAIPLAGS